MATNGSADYGPSVRVARLYQRKSKTGTTYFAGRWGGTKVALVKSKDTGDQGEPIWNLLLSEAPQQKTEEKPSAEAKAASAAPARANFDKQLDDEIPF